MSVHGNRRLAEGISQKSIRRFPPDTWKPEQVLQAVGHLPAEFLHQHRLLRRIKLGKLDKPVGLALSPDEKRLYVATGRGDSVVAIDTASLAPVASVRVGTRPWGIALTADGRKLYTANGISEDVSVVDTATMRVTATIKVPGGPWGVVRGAPPSRR